MESDPIDALRSHPQPPEDLERRIVAAVRAAGGLQARRSLGRVWLAAAAAAIIFVAGVGVGSRWWPAQADEVAPGRARYLLLLAGDVTPAAGGGTRSAEYGAWARAVSATGVFVRGAELSPTVRLVGAAADTPLARELASVGGYFIIEAETEDEAVRLAASCPHVKYGGAVQVRKLL